MLEIQIEDQRHGECAEEDQHVIAADSVPTQMLDDAVEPERAEEERNRESREWQNRLGPRHRAVPLPVEVLEVVAVLCRQRRHAWDERRLVVLVPGQGRGEFGTPGLPPGHDAR